MIRVSDLKLPLDYDAEKLKKLSAKQLGVSEDKIKNVRLFRRSVDARRKDNITFTATVDVELKIDENSVLRRCKSNKACIPEEYAYELPKGKKLDKRPVVVGAGPAGLFCALMLSRAGQRPVLIERGKCVDERTADVNVFWSGGKLNTESNVQFGEGGAGTFSDGKLNSAIKDPDRQRKAKHVVYENLRTLEAVSALKAGDLERFGKLMNESHVSLRDDYDVTGPELDTLAEEAWKCPGVIGSRMTGGGFGGCTVSIVENGAVENFMKQVGEGYQKRIGYPASFYVVEIGGGPCRLD